MEEKKAGLGGDCEANFIGHFQPAATFEMFFGEEDLHATKKLFLIRRWEAEENRDVALDDRFPR